MEHRQDLFKDLGSNPVLPLCDLGQLLWAPIASTVKWEEGNKRAPSPDE